MVSSIMYLAILIRPDIAFALGRLSQFLLDLADYYIKALKGLIRYTRSTSDFRITFKPDLRGDKLIGYSNLDFAIDKSNRRLVLGNVFMLARGPISWMSKKQKSVATSTMDAEYMAMCSCAKQSQLLAHLIRDIGYKYLIR